MPLSDDVMTLLNRQINRKSTCIFTYNNYICLIYEGKIITGITLKPEAHGRFTIYNTDKVMTSTDEWFVSSIIYHEYLYYQRFISGSKKTFELYVKRSNIYCKDNLTDEIIFNGIPENFERKYQSWRNAHGMPIEDPSSLQQSSFFFS